MLIMIPIYSDITKTFILSDFFHFLLTEQFEHNYERQILKINLKKQELSFQFNL